MAKKADRGTKRICGECGNKFYDLGKDPILCPICEAEFVPVVVQKPEPKTAEKESAETEEVAKPKDGPEIVSLEEAEAAEADDADAIDDEDIIDLPDDDEEIPDADDDDTFLETDDESDGDVTGIIDTPITKEDES